MTVVSKDLIYSLSARHSKGLLIHMHTTFIKNVKLIRIQQTYKQTTMGFAPDISFRLMQKGTCIEILRKVQVQLESVFCIYLIMQSGNFCKTFPYSAQIDSQSNQCQFYKLSVITICKCIVNKKPVWHELDNGQNAHRQIILTYRGCASGLE